MHELSITQSIFDIVLEESSKHKIKKVSTINIKVGKLRGVLPECLEMYFEVISKDTKLQGVVLKIEVLPIRIKCNCCENENSVFDEFKCLKCNSRDVSIIGGKEFFIESIEGE